MTVPAEPFRRVVIRQAFHAFNAAWGVLAYHFLVPRWVAAAAVGTVTAMFGFGEWLRLHRPEVQAEILRHPVFGRVIRPHEHDRFSGGFWFGVGVFAVLVMYPRPVVEAACLVMGFGDAASTVLGRRFGTWRLPGGRSLQGTLAFAVTSLVVVAAWRAGAWGDPAATALAWGGLAGLAGAVTELLSTRVDDNLSVPVVTGGVLWAVMGSGA
jgi:dolichol kinase